MHKSRKYKVQLIKIHLLQYYMILFVLTITTLATVSAYTTTVDSQYTKHPLMASGYCWMSNHGAGPMTQNTEIRIWTFPHQITGVVDGFAIINQWYDTVVRDVLDFSVKLTGAQSTYANITYYQNHRPVSLGIISYSLSVRILVYDTVRCSNLKYYHHLNQSITTNNQIYFYFYSPFDVKKDFQAVSFVTGYHQDGPTLNRLAEAQAYRLYPLQSTICLRYRLLPQVGVTIGMRVLVVYFTNEDPIQIIDLNVLVSNSAQNSVSIVLPTSHYYVVGLYMFKINNYAAMFQLKNSSNIYSIIQPTPTESLNLSCAMNYMIIKDLQHAPPPPFPPLYQIQLTTLISYSSISSTFVLVYRKIPNFQNINISQVFINQTQKISILSAIIQGDQLRISCSYSENIQGLPIQVKLNWLLDNYSSTATTNLKLQANPPLKYFSQQVLAKTKVIFTFFEVIQYVYLAIFVISLFSSKLIGLQVISLAQLTFYCQIPMGVVSFLFIGPTKMTSISGYNYKFPSLPQKNLSVIYESMGISSNFLSNANIMLLLVALCPLISGLLMFSSHISKSYKHKPRCKLYSIAFLCQWSFVLIAFNAYNICSSFVVNLENPVKDSPAGLIVGVLITLLLIVVVAIYTIFRTHYLQFKSQFDDSGTSRCFPAEKIKLLCSLYPTVLVCEMILCSSFLTSEKLSNFSLYFVLVIVFITTVYISTILPYYDKLSNIRLLIQRVLMILVIIVTIVCKAKMTVFDSEESVYPNLVFIVMGVMIIGLIINIPFVIWNSIKWFKKKGVIDMKMYLEYRGKVDKQQAVHVSNNPGYYPILQFGIGRQRLLDRENNQRELNLSNMRSINHNNSNFMNKREIDDGLQCERVQ